MSRLRLVAAFAALAFPILAAPLPALALDPADRPEIEAIVRDYIMQNPEIIRDAMAELEKRRVAEEERARKAGITDHAQTIFDSPRQVVLGNPKGDVTLVEFFDYNCGYCKRAHGDMKRLLDEDPNLRIVLKEFPVLGPGSGEAAQVAVAVNKIAPEKYGAFHDALITLRGEANGARALAAATGIGLDENALRAEMQAPLVNETLSEVYGLAETLGINGTPSYVVGDEVVVGAVGYDALKEKIESVRACGSTSC